MAGGRHDLLPGEGTAAALDQVQMTGGFIGAVYVDRDLIHAVEVKHRDAVTLEPLRTGLGTGHRTVNSVFDARQGVNEVICGRSGTDTDYRAGLHVLQCGLRCHFFHVIRCHLRIPSWFEWVRMITVRRREVIAMAAQGEICPRR